MGLDTVVMQMSNRCIEDSYDFYDWNSHRRRRLRPPILVDTGA